MAPKGCAGLLPIPCRSGKLDSVAHLSTSRLLVVAERPCPSQPARTGAMGSSLPSLDPVDSPTPHSASLSRCTLRHQSSTVRAICVNALVRICAGGDQRWSSLPRQLSDPPPERRVSVGGPRKKKCDLEALEIAGPQPRKQNGCDCIRGVENARQSLEMIRFLNKR